MGIITAQATDVILYITSNEITAQRGYGAGPESEQEGKNFLGVVPSSW